LLALQVPNQSLTKILVVFSGMSSIIMIPCPFIPFRVHQRSLDNMFFRQESQQIKGGRKVNFFRGPAFFKGLPQFQITTTTTIEVIHIEHSLNVGSAQDAPPGQCLANGIGWNVNFHGTPTFAFLKPTRLVFSIIR
jgi:hypothetical protein